MGAFVLRVITALGFRGCITLAIIIASVIFLGLHIAHDADVAQQLKTAQASLTSWVAYGQAEKRAFDSTQAARTREQTVAQASAGDQAKMCQARVDEARRSSAAITTLISKESAHDPQTGCPVRSLMDPGELRDALQPPAAHQSSEAAGLRPRLNG